MSLRTMIISAALLVTMSSSFFAYYKHTQNTIESLRRSNGELAVAVEQQKVAYEIAEKKYKQQTTSLSMLLTSNAKLVSEKEALSTKLMEHDLEELSKRKPVLVEKRINDGTKKLFDSFTTLTTE